MLRFQEEFSKEELWWPYKAAAEFERLLRVHLTNFIRDKFRLESRAERLAEPALADREPEEPTQRGKAERPAWEKAEQVQLPTETEPRPRQPAATRDYPSDRRTGNYDVFISYRRDAGHAEARAIRSALRERGVQVFLDVADVRRGYFDEALLRQIADTPNFIVVLSLNSLDRCIDEEDWLRREIAQAIKTRRNIIPILMPGFTFPRELPPDIRNLSRYQGPEYSHRYFDAMIVEIAENLEREKAEAENQRTAKS